MRVAPARTRPGEPPAKAIHSWRLFLLLALAISLAICLRLPQVDLPSAEGLRSMIRQCVRCALPCFLVAFTASSLATLAPGPGTRWLLANRRYFGLAFAFGMAWHFAFIGLLARGYFQFLFGQVLDPTITTLDSIGALFLLAMTVTSFPRLCRRLSARAWRVLHKSGIYVIWGLLLYIYLGDAVRAGGTDRRPWLAVIVLLAAGLLRFTAWRRASHASR